jgi:hypothetical protein
MLLMVLSLAAPSAPAAAGHEGTPAAAPPARADGAASPEALLAELAAAAGAADRVALARLLAFADRQRLALAKLRGLDFSIAVVEQEAASNLALAAAPDRDDDDVTAQTRAAAARRHAELLPRALEQRARYRALLTRHRIVHAPRAGGVALRLLDEAAFTLPAALDHAVLLADLDRLDGELHPPHPDDVAPATAGPPPTDLRVEGERATASAGGRRVELVRVDGRWYLSLPPVPRVVEPGALPCPERSWAPAPMPRR